MRWFMTPAHVSDGNLRWFKEGVPVRRSISSFRAAAEVEGVSMVVDGEKGKLMLSALRSDHLKRPPTARQRPRSTIMYNIDGDRLEKLKTIQNTTISS